MRIHARWACLAASGLVAFGLLSVSNAGVAATRHPASPAATASAAPLKHSQIFSVSVVPHSTSAWALAAHPVSISKAYFYALHRVGGGHWSVHALPRPKKLNLEQVYAPSAHSIWIDGTLGSGRKAAPYLLHSTGGAFHRVAIPGLPHGILNAIGGSSTHDIWAGGATTVNEPTPISLHYNGKKWSVVPFAGEPSDSGLVAVASSGAHNAWAISESGYSIDDLSPSTYHWNGTSWTEMAIPNPDAALGAIATTGTSHAWAVGSNVLTSGRLVTYLLSWNGHAWVHAHTASPSKTNNVLQDVAAAGKRVWAVGYRDQGAAFENPIVERLVGAKWKVVAAPHIGRKTYLSAVGVSSKAVVGVGYYYPGSRKFIIGGSDSPAPLVEGPHGSHWAIESAPH
ncbi:MAG TPA: hypothetical protein VME70_04075 [Mycobacteriales bacterium]|nr:hypothetical protein [Mycobacteriales bacterium]